DSAWRERRHGLTRRALTHTWRGGRRGFLLSHTPILQCSPLFLPSLLFSVFTLSALHTPVKVCVCVCVCVCAHMWTRKNSRWASAGVHTGDCLVDLLITCHS